MTFAGFLPNEDLPNIYRAADIFVMPGVAELQSIATMEAMASGLPVVAVDAMALPELVHDGKNGYLFKDGDLQTFADRVVALITDENLRKKMGQKSLDIIKAHDIHKSVEIFEQVYKDVISKYVKTEKRKKVAKSSKK